MRRSTTTLLIAILASSCASGAGDDDDPVPVAIPSLESVAPSEIALGDEVKLLGRDFPDPRDGQMSLRLTGVYTDSAGETHDFASEFLVETTNDSVASFRMDDLYFSPTRDKIGTFAGTAELIVVAAADGAEPVVSAPLDVDLRILPSIRIDQLRAVDRGCGDATSATIANTEIELSASAIGLGEASSERPWRAKVSFLSPQIGIRYLVPGTYDFWPPTINDDLATPAPDGTNSMSFPIVQGNTVRLDPSSIEQKVRISPPVTIGQQVHDEVVIHRMATGPVDYLGVQYGNFVIEIDANDGRVLRRNVSLAIWSELEIGLWDGDERLLRRFAPEATSGCIAGGALGIDLTYTEGESVTRTRSVGFRWDDNAAATAGLTAGSINFFQVNASESWSETFGVDINESVSSEAHTSQGLQVHVIPSYFGMSYRQLEQLERKVEIKYHNACGASGVVGEALLTNWNFGFDVATGPACPPPSNLPGAETFE